MNVWITGAKGFIGRHVARHLANAGHAVAGVGHGLWPDSERAQWGVGEWLQSSVDVPSLHQLGRRASPPDAIVHFAGGSSVGAALANPREDASRTVGSSAELLEWMRLAAPRARLLVASSAAVYGAGHEGPIPEEAAPTPYSPYGHHKLMMEQLCRSYAASYGLDVTVLRLFSVYGPELRKQLLWDSCSKLAAGARVLRLGGTGDERRDWTHVEDVASAVEAALSRPGECAGVLNVGTGRGTAVRDVAAAVVQAWGGVTAVEFDGASRPGDPFSLVADVTRLGRLGCHLRVDPVWGIASYVGWFKKRLPS